MDATLRTRFLGRDLATPLVLPAGVLGTSFSSLLACARAGAGIVTTKSATLHPRSGHPGPVVVETPSGLLNAVGLSNPGIVEVLREVADYRRHTDTPIAVSVFSDNASDFADLARYVDNSAADFLELNLSCPNVVDEFGVPLAASPDTVARIVDKVKAVCGHKVITKLSPNVSDIGKVARAAQDAGADAICAINTVGPGMAIDIELNRPILFNREGGLSGPAIRPLAIRAVWQIAASVTVPIIGVGGVAASEDVIEMIMAGASLVGIGTALYESGPELFRSVADALGSYLSRKGFCCPSEIPSVECRHV